MIGAPAAKLVIQRFEAIVERGLLAQDLSEGRYWVAVRVPFDPHEIWPVAKPLRIRGTINGFPVRSTLFGNRETGRLLLVTRAMQKLAKVAPGSRIEVELEPDVDGRSAVAPPQLAKILKSDRALKKYFEKLNYSMRSWMVSQIEKPKSPDARVRVAEQIAEQMMLAMEAEEELPPILRVAFQRQPLALAGWNAMTPIQRRNHLLAIFHCQGTESRAKRTDSAVQEAVRIARKKAGSKSSFEFE
jgi:uncharacterized protein YdeI (YjbR/CyaY-like superfamily)